MARFYCCSTPSQGPSYSLNMLRLARITGARTLFFFTELQPDGQIDVTFSKPPDPFCSTEETIQENLLALDRETKRILSGRPGYSCSIIVTGSSASQKKIPAK